MAAERPVLTVLSRDYCHLCHEMVAALRELEARHGFTLDVVDVDEHPALEAQFGERVPVLLAGGEELCHWRLDAAALQAWLTRKYHDSVPEQLEVIPAWPDTAKFR